MKYVKKCPNLCNLKNFQTTTYNRCRLEEKILETHSLKSGGGGFSQIIDQHFRNFNGYLNEFYQNILIMLQSDLYAFNK